jgi:hypothetical protein
MVGCRTFLVACAALALMATPTPAEEGNGGSPRRRQVRVMRVDPATSLVRSSTVDDMLETAPKRSQFQTASHRQFDDEQGGVEGCDVGCSAGGDAQCAAPCETCCRSGKDACDCFPYWAHSHYVFGEYLNLRPTGVDMAHAIQQNGAGGQGTVPTGLVGVLAPQWTPAFRVGFGVALGQCSSVGVAFTNFQSHTTDSLIAPDGLGGTVASLVLHPNSINAGSTSSLVNAQYDIDFKLVDVDYRRLLCGGDQHFVNYVLGVRYGKLNQQFQQIGNFAPPNGTMQTTTGIRFDGAGVHTGFDGQHQIYNRRFGVYGKGFVSVLFGQFRTEYEQLDTTSTIVQAASRWRDYRAVPILDFELGINWTSCNEHWRVATGYYTAYWFNAITTSQYIQAVQTANFVGVGDTVAFNGLVARLECRF